MAKYRFSRANFEDNIKDFKIRRIVRDDGTIDLERYQSWFIHYYSEKKNDSIKSSIITIEEANFIAKEACHDLKISETLIPKDGNMNEEKITQLILKDVSKEQVKKELKDIFNNIFKEEKDEKEPLVIEKTTVDKQDNDTNDSNLNDNEALTKACLLLIPIIRQLELENDLSSNVEEKENPEEYTNLLKDYGFDEKQIASAMEAIRKDIADTEKEKKKNKDEQYNAYNDWRYIYYMSTLGSGFSIYYDKSASLFETVNSLKSELNHEKHASNYNEEKKVFDHKTAFKELLNNSSKDDNKQEEKINQYLLHVMMFRSTYNIEVDKDFLISDFLSVYSKEEFTNLYKQYLQKYYEEGKDNIKDFPKFISDFDSLIKDTCSLIDKKHYSRFGGMNGEQMVVFGMSLRENEFNISKQLANEVSSKFGDIKKVNGESLVNFLEEKFNNANMQILDAEENHNLMRDAMACYLLLKDTHENRTKGYMFAHPINYFKEAQSVKRMKQIMENHISASKEEEALEFEEMERRNTVLDVRYTNEANRLRNFSRTFANEDIEIDNSFEMDFNNGGFENVIENNNNEPIISENSLQNNNN